MDVSEWLLCLFLPLAILSFAIVAERSYFFYRRRASFQQLLAELNSYLSLQAHEKLKQLYEHSLAPEKQAIVIACRYRDEASAKLILDCSLTAQRLDRYLYALSNIGKISLGLGVLLFAIQASTSSLVFIVAGTSIALPAILSSNSLQRLVDDKRMKAHLLMKSIFASPYLFEEDGMKDWEDARRRPPTI